jgi:RHS repeat-associated protein
VVESYSYDDNGNRIYWQLGSANPQTAKYDSQDRILEFGNVAYQFDDDGFMTQRGATAFEYSSRGELTKVMLPDGKVISYAYDGVGRRVARSSYAGTYEYLYGNPEKPFQVTAIREPSGVLTVYYYDDFGLLFAMQRDEDWFYVATDQLGTPIVVVDTGETVKVVKYDSFGNQVADSNSGFVLPIGFAAGLVDWETKLVRFGFRDYDPASGRWCAKDPIGFAAGDSNLYRYVNLNPVGFVDRSGEDGESILDYIPSLKTSEQNNLESIINRKPPVCDGSAQIKSPADDESKEDNPKDNSEDNEQEQPTNPRKPAPDFLQVDKGQLTFDSEGNDNPKSPYYSRKAHRPPGNSGITIGRGYDIGQHTKEKVVQDLTKAGIPEKDAKIFAEAAGKKGKKAQTYFDENKDSFPEITRKQQNNLFRTVYKEYLDGVKRISSKEDVVKAYGPTNFKTLNPAIRDVVVDLMYRGDYTGTTRKKLQKHVAKNDLDEFLKVMSDSNFWQKNTKVSPVPQDRFDRRVNFLKEAKKEAEKQNK